LSHVTDAHYSTEFTEGLNIGNFYKGLTTITKIICTQTSLPENVIEKKNMPIYEAVLRPELPKHEN
jgi:hypothetical protein